MIETLVNATFEATLSNAPSGQVGTIAVQVFDATTATVTIARHTSGITEFPVGSGFYITQMQAPADPGDYVVMWDDGTISPQSTSEEVLRVSGLPSGPPPSDTLPATRADIRVLVPRVRRAVEGVGSTAVLTDDQVKDLVADAIADIILYTGGLWGHELLVTEASNGIPTEYATDEPLTLPEGSVVAAQAALTYLVRELSSLKTGETIRDEGQEWTWQASAQAVSERIRELRQTRDMALTVISAQHFVPVEFFDFVCERDRRAELVDPRLGLLR